MHWYVNYPESETFLSPMYNVDFSYPAHLHGCLEMTFCIHGTVTVGIGGQDYQLEDGWGVLIPPNWVHSYYTPDTSAYCTILFSRNLLPDLSALFIGKEPASFIFPMDEPLRQQLLTFYDSSQTLFSGKSLLYRASDAFLRDNTLLPREHTDNDLSLQIIAYIQDNLTAELTLQDLADHLGYSYHYVSKQVHQLFHLPFTQLLAQYRVAYAKQLLDNRRYTISQAAMASGFGSIRSFNRIFSNLMGVTPSQYLANTVQPQVLRP